MAARLAFIIGGLTFFCLGVLIYKFLPVDLFHSSEWYLQNMTVDAEHYIDTLCRIITGLLGFSFYTGVLAWKWQKVDDQEDDLDIYDHFID